MLLLREFSTLHFLHAVGAGSINTSVSTEVENNVRLLLDLAFSCDQHIKLVSTSYPYGRRLTVHVGMRFFFVAG